MSVFASDSHSISLFLFLILLMTFQPGTRSALPSTPAGNKGVGFGVGVPFRAMRLLGVEHEGTADASISVLKRGYGFKMMRVDASAVSTEMVDLQAVRNLSLECHIRESMSHSGDSVLAKGPVTDRAYITSPIPAARIGIDTEFGEEPFKWGKLGHVNSPMKGWLRPGRANATGHSFM